MTSIHSLLNSSANIMLININDQYLQSFINNQSMVDDEPKIRPIDKITAEEVIIVLIVLGLWCWACTLFYIR